MSSSTSLSQDSAKGDVQPHIILDVQVQQKQLTLPELLSAKYSSQNESWLYFVDT